MLGHIDNTEVVRFQVPPRPPNHQHWHDLARQLPSNANWVTVPERSESRSCLPTTDLSAFNCAKGIYRQLLLTRVAKPAASTILRVADNPDKVVQQRRTSSTSIVALIDALASDLQALFRFRPARRQNRMAQRRKANRGCRVLSWKKSATQKTFESAAG